MESLSRRSIKGLSSKIETALNGATDGMFEGLQVTATQCNYGGLRYWWQCPKCGRRVGVLYSLPWLKSWACRHCHGAVHESSQTGRYKRELNKAMNLLFKYSRKPLAVLLPFDFLDIDDKPPEMRWRAWMKIFVKQATARNKAVNFHLRAMDWARRGCMTHEEIVREWHRINEAQRATSQAGKPRI
ncbi:hypothetical protein VSS37_13390 [Candidatus Thiothrix sp. Deng01]|uniref:Transposase zinc-ribbon domain-containing protein n=1 Tax=Candidatus Thiothrix phosphatis TaxID=3112415 RepID=A0ABU6CZI4_9GAMM|nr:hypothetical protein [Candidatus Thiothrix sp. Deng01]MEB4591981.1 hypothetical protein [Candidatus Thiothrix sp. Deng01]